MSAEKSIRNKFIILIFASFLGMITGLIAVFFNYSLNICRDFIVNLDAVKINGLLYIPIIGGFLIGMINHFFLKNDKTGFGVIQVMIELGEIKTFMMKPINVVIKVVGTFITLLFGLSAGRFGPTVHIGGAIGSNFAYMLNFDDDNTRLFIGCGVAGSIAGIFESPIFATLFVIEVLLKKRYFNFFTPIVLSSVTSLIVKDIILDESLFLHMSGNFGFLGITELKYYIILGIVLGGLSALYMLTLNIGKRVFQKYIGSRFLRALLGGVLVALIGYLVPQIYDLHFDVMKMVLHNEFTINVLALMILAKLIATSITLGTGFVGGNLLPGIYIGASMGSLYGSYISSLGADIFSVETYAIVGMGAMMSGFLHAPMSSVILIMELTGNLNAVLPFLLCSSISIFVSDIIYKKDVYTYELQQYYHEKEKIKA